mgnify:FL=1
MNEKRRYRSLNVRFKEDEWNRFMELVEDYREHFKMDVSMHMVAKHLIRAGQPQVRQELLGQPPKLTEIHQKENISL